jgi:hypothetical protein
MDSIYVFKYTPASIKRLIYVYLIGLGTPSSNLIKDEYKKIYEKYKDTIIVNDHMCYMIDKDLGFMGYKTSAQKFFKRTVAVGLYKDYKGDIGEKSHEDCLLPQHIYEIDGAKMFYLYNYSNAHKFNIIYTLRSDNHSLEKLFKYKILQLNREEDGHEQEEEQENETKKHLINL